LKIVFGRCKKSPAPRRFPHKTAALLMSVGTLVGAVHVSAGMPAVSHSTGMTRSVSFPLSVSAAQHEASVSLTVDDDIDLLLDGEEIDSGVSATYDGKLDIPANVRLDKFDFGEDFAKPLRTARVTSRFDYRVNPVTGRYVFHTGIDLAAPQGSSIYAMKAGKVVRSAYDSGYGNFVIIEHDNGVRTLYAHCQKRKVSAGDTVRQGQVIALVGSTGHSTGPHLHLEFRVDGRRCDPEWVIGGVY
ncbi:MAG: M23 family metallopeptidase, partial [Clostridia bacterium]|nr:M23 family metallopeptidase [Clostridia bacterium]